MRSLKHILVHPPAVFKTPVSIHASIRLLGLKHACSSTLPSAQLNRDDYIYPVHRTSLGPVCAPNYNPDTDDASRERWANYSAYYRSLLVETAERYADSALFYTTIPLRSLHTSSSDTT